MAGTAKVRFTRTYVVKDDEGRKYEDGKVYEMSPESAQHFVNRGAAVIVTRGAKPAPEAASIAPPETAVLPPGRPRTPK